MRTHLFLIGLLFFALGCGRATRAVPAPKLLVVPDEPRAEAERSAEAPVEPMAAEKDRPAVQVVVRKQGPTGEFEFPKDDAGKELAKSLPAGAGLQLPVDALSPPRSHTPLTSITHPSLPLPPPPTASVLLSARPSPMSARPGKVGEQSPFISYLGDPQLPASELLATGVVVGVASPDVSEALMPPTLGTMTSDRVPLEDPTIRTSREAALAAVPPARTNPAPFQKNNLPDPYENRLVGRLRTPPPEDPVPPLAPPRLPRP